jgi:hypothetical protein
MGLSEFLFFGSGFHSIHSFYALLDTYCLIMERLKSN